MSPFEDAQLLAGRLADQAGIPPVYFRPVELAAAFPS